MTSLSALSDAETIETLESVSWAMKHFSGMAAGTMGAKLVVLERRGLVESMGQCYVCDDDGFALDPEQEDECFALTPAGRALLDKDEAERTERFTRSEALVAARRAGREAE